MKNQQVQRNFSFSFNKFFRDTEERFSMRKRRKKSIFEVGLRSHDVLMYRVEIFFKSIKLTIDS